MSRRIKSHVLDRLVGFFCFFFFLFLFLGAGWVAGCSKGLPEFVTDWIWILWYENQNCQIVWSWHTPLPPFLLFQSPSLLCPFLFHVRSDIQLDDSFKQNGQNQPTNNSRAAGTLLTYLLYFFAHRASDKTGLAVMCVCVCVFFFLCFWVCLSLYF